MIKYKNCYLDLAAYITGGRFNKKLHNSQYNKIEVEKQSLKKEAKEKMSIIRL